MMTDRFARALPVCRRPDTLAQNYIDLERSARALPPKVLDHLFLKENLLGFERLIILVLAMV